MAWPISIQEDFHYLMIMLTLFMVLAEYFAYSVEIEVDQARNWVEVPAIVGAYIWTGGFALLLYQRFSDWCLFPESLWLLVEQRGDELAGCLGWILLINLFIVAWLVWPVTMAYIFIRWIAEEVFHEDKLGDVERRAIGFAGGAVVWAADEQQGSFDPLEGGVVDERTPLLGASGKPWISQERPAYPNQNRNYVIIQAHNEMRDQYGGGLENGNLDADLDDVDSDEEMRSRGITRLWGGYSKGIWSTRRAQSSRV